MLQVTDPGFLVTVQDLGRPGVQRLGIPLGGAIDRFALKVANRLVGNDFGAAGLECAGEGPLLVAGEDLLVAGSGRGFTLVAGTCSYPLWMAVFVPQGEVFGLRSNGAGGWGILAVSGGLEVPELFGSRSTYLRGAFGGLQGSRLRFGDVLPVGDQQPAGTLAAQAGRSLPRHKVPAYGDEINVRVIPCADQVSFTPSSLQQFYREEYRVTDESDRMGYRLNGAQLERASTGEVLTEGTTSGLIQVPGGGQPVVLMCDAQTTGGYPALGVVVGVDLPLLAQCPPGVGRVHFTAITREQAVEARRAQTAFLQSTFWEEA